MSKKELILVRRLRKLTILTSAYSVFLGVFMIYLVATPVYLVEGVVRGYVALTRYELLFYDTPLRCDTFTSVSLLTIPILILSVFLIFTGALTLYLFFNNRDFHTGIRLMLGGALSSQAFLGYIFALVKVVSTAIASLNINLNQVTSAGILYLGISRVSLTYPAGYLLSPLTLLPAILTYVFLASATYLHETLIEELKTS